MSTTDAESKAEAYAIFCGPIEQNVLARFFKNLVEATTAREDVKYFHILFQSTGGTVGDCVCLHNLLRSYPRDLTLYNAGMVQSGAVTAYLGAKRRKTSAHSQFMIHRAHCTGQFASITRLESTAACLRMDDARTEAILRTCTRLPDEILDQMAFGDVFLTGPEAVKYGLADEIAEFSPPPGLGIYTL
jgi:ATP-dependent Clp protease protease subunit